MRVIINALQTTHVSEDTVGEVERAILSDPRVRSVHGNHLFPRTTGAIVWRLYEHFSPRLLSILFSLRLCDEHFAVLMGPRFRKCAPYFSTARRRHVYLFDAWPQWHEAIRRFVRVFRVDTLFVSSSQVAAKLDPIGRCRAYWVPEGIDLDEYQSPPHIQRSIDVLELGRRHEAYHHLVTPALATGGRLHIYESKPGELVFPDRAAFIAGLARTKVSICFPSNITTPERAGDIETMTIRYLQSMVSKCLVVGHAPAEMLSLFGYNPVVEADMRHPAEQLLAIIMNYPQYLPLIERNYETVRARHTWEERWNTMRSLLTPRNPACPPVRPMDGSGPTR